MNELARLLESTLKIPVDSGIDYGTFAEVIYNNRNLGTVQLVKTPGNVIIDTSSPSVNNLKWDFIYENNSDEINKLVTANYAIDNNDITITLGTFRVLYIRDLEGKLLGSCTCNYEDGCWLVLQNPE